MIQDYPATARFLSEEERQFIILRLKTDDQLSAAGEIPLWRDAWKGITDWKTWVGASVVIGMWYFQRKSKLQVKALMFTLQARTALFMPSPCFFLV